MIEEQPHEIKDVVQRIYDPDGCIKSTSAKAGEMLGEDGRPLIESLKRVRPYLKAMTKSPGRQARNTRQALARLDEVVKGWEDKFGGVKGN